MHVQNPPPPPESMSVRSQSCAFTHCNLVIALAPLLIAHVCSRLASLESARGSLRALRCSEALHAQIRCRRVSFPGGVHAGFNTHRGDARPCAPDSVGAASAGCAISTNTWRRRRRNWEWGTPRRFERTEASNAMYGAMRHTDTNIRRMRLGHGRRALGKRPWNEVVQRHMTEDWP